MILQDQQESTEAQKLPTWTELRDQDPEADSKRAAVTEWLKQIELDTDHWSDDFKRIRSDIEFATGLQRPGQTKLESSEYQVNLVVRAINQKVAALYARNPRAEWQARKRRYFQIWDGEITSLIPLAAKAMNGIPVTPEEAVLMADYTNGMKRKKLIANLGETLDIAYQYQLDTQEQDFKLEMKALIRRVCTCGVGYLRVSVVREPDVPPITTEGMGNTVMARAMRIQEVLRLIEEEAQDWSSPRLEELKALVNSLHYASSGQEDEFTTGERLLIEFLPSLSVIPYRGCRALKGFTGCPYITIEYMLPISEINAQFGCDLGTSLSDYKIYRGGEHVELKSGQDNSREDKPFGRLLEVINKIDKTHFFLVEGCKDYVLEPEPLEPQVPGFWPIRALSFNDVESDPSTKASPYPPSDVFLMRHPQREWNRAREEWRKHRNASVAKYIAKQGTLTTDDKEKLEFSESHAIIEIQGVAESQKVNDLLQPMTHDKLAPELFNTEPCLQDILFSIGAQDANLGRPNAGDTATGQSIAEQSRNLGLSSNIDDVDDALTWLSGSSGALMLQVFSRETIVEIVGEGAVWPDENDRVALLKEIHLKHVAASSGRPNRALDLQNWALVEPMLAAAGVNPMFRVRELIRRLDDSLDPAEALPLTPQQPMQQGTPSKPRSDRVGQPPPPQGRPGPGVLGPRNRGPISRTTSQPKSAV